MIIKLRNQLIVTIMAFISIIMLVAFISIYMVSYLRISNENTEKINSDEMITVSSDGQMMFEDQVVTDAFVINRISPALGVYFNLITDASGNLVWYDSALVLTPEDYALAAAIATENPSGGIAEFAERKWQYAAIMSDEQQLTLDGTTSVDGLTFVRFLDVTESYNTLGTLRLTLTGLYFVLVLVFFFLARYFANRSIQPMAEAWESQRQFIADASHELKTPISTLHANLDILYASQEDSIRQQVKWLDNSKKVLGRMMALIQSMLELAKVDEGSETYTVESVSINQLLNESVDSFVPLAEQRNINIIEDAAPDLSVYSNYGLLQQVVEIFVDNAVKYTDDGGQIRISAVAEKGGIVIEVQNTGQGISPADMGKIFDRFYRGDKSRVYKEDSYGLGLSIAKAAVKKMGGEIHVRSNSEWSTFTVRVPEKKSR